MRDHFCNASSTINRISRLCKELDFNLERQGREKERERERKRKREDRMRVVTKISIASTYIETPARNYIQVDIANTSRGLNM